MLLLPVAALEVTADGCFDQLMPGKHGQQHNDMKQVAMRSFVSGILAMGLP